MKQIFWYRRKCYRKARWKRKALRLIKQIVNESYPDITEEERKEMYDGFIARLGSGIRVTGYYSTGYN